MSSGVFVSYRRSDSAHFAGRLVDSISSSLPDARVFIDVDSISLGQDFVEVLNEQLTACSAMIVVIGPRWLDKSSKNGQARINDPADFIRLEIEAALARKIPVIPVLVDGAELPGELEIPESLRPMRRRQGVRIDHENYAAIVRRLIPELAKLLGPATADTVSAKPVRGSGAPTAKPGSEGHGDSAPSGETPIPPPRPSSRKRKIKIAGLFLSGGIAVVYTLVTFSVSSKDRLGVLATAVFFWVLTLLVWRMVRAPRA